MADNSDEILRAYMEKVLALRREREQQSLSDDDLSEIARESGMSDEDLAFVQSKLDEYMRRGEGFMRYRNWGDAIDQLEQAETLAPNNAVVLAALATSYLNRWRGDPSNRSDRDSAQAAARRCLAIDPANDRALRVLSGTQEEEPVSSDSSSLRTPYTAQQRRPPVARFMLVAALIAMLGVGAAALLFTSKGGSASPPQAAPRSTQAEAVAPEAPEPPAAPEAPSKDAGPATRLLAFGKEGIGPGMFDDARSVAVDAGGHVYVSEYSGGRVQVFDSAGTFLTQWKIGGRVYMRDLTADRAGNVYAVYDGAIHRFDGMTGAARGEINYSGGRGFISAAATPDGGFIAAWDGWYRGGLLIDPEAKDAIVRLDAKGRTKMAARTAVSRITDQFETDVEVVEDGVGTIYALSTRSGNLLKFKPNGTFIDRINTDVPPPGGAASSDRHTSHFLRATAIATDGLGRLYVAGGRAITVFDSNGALVNTIDADASISDIAVDDTGAIWVLADRHQVIKLRWKPEVK